MPSHESEALEDKQKLQMKTFSELAEFQARIPPKKLCTDFFLNTITWDVFCLECLVLIFCLQSTETRISSRKQDDFVGFRSIRSSTSGRSTEKSGMRSVCPQVRGHLSALHHFVASATRAIYQKMRTLLVMPFHG